MRYTLTGKGTLIVSSKLPLKYVLYCLTNTEAFQYSSTNYQSIDRVCIGCANCSRTLKICTEAGLQSELGGDDAIVFLKNKNLQRLPTDYMGVMVWLACMKSTCAVVKSNFELASVQTLYPRSRKGQKHTIKTRRLEGVFL
jgi:hypothetical protein